MLLPKKTIFIDCDGVLLDWEEAFHDFMSYQGYIRKEDNPGIYGVVRQYNISSMEEGRQLIRQFNESAMMAFLKPIYQAKDYVELLSSSLDYKFYMITSMTQYEPANKLRIMNLKNVFGANKFVHIEFLDVGADKNGALAEAKLLADAAEIETPIWIEDKPENADVGHSLGFDSILIQHHYNESYSGSAKVLRSWREIFYYIVGR